LSVSALEERIQNLKRMWQIYLVTVFTHYKLLPSPRALLTGKGSWCTKENIPLSTRSDWEVNLLLNVRIFPLKRLHTRKCSAGLGLENLAVFKD